MGENVLITGGAGFIGSHVADALLAKGHRVRVLDCLHPQVHGPSQKRPEYLSRDVELIIGDVRDRAAVEKACRGIDVVYHFAALVGVGQSMYRIEDYTSVNNVGTSVLMEVLAQRPPRRVIVASSMSIYGEGLYERVDGSIVPGQSRSLAQLERRDWELRDARGNVLVPVATHEDKIPALESVYALSKYDQERMSLIIGRAYGIPTVALRFFNVYGPRQALSNPYTGVLAIFSSRLLNDKAPMIFEDGKQRRDFVSVHDVAQACVLAMEREQAVDSAINVGSGNAYTVSEIAARVADAVGKRVDPEITGQYRKGDIRHCVADIALARKTLGYEPRVSLEAGLRELAGWLEGKSAKDAVLEAKAELSARGLTL
ncbi:SDR family NAD(P)-dependent oxidoreductase [Sandaracinus amylolyticus]|nr:SDR family NAD(P)-dependent oxidoreductase [Sandaracinus amylolyticus]